MAQRLGPPRQKPPHEVAEGVTHYLVRHAKAGDRTRWTEPDDLRPLTKPGIRQAAGLVPLLEDEGVDRVLSSPYVRCVQTVEPLAAERGLPVEHHDALAEGASLDSTLSLLGSLEERPAVLCTHGDVVENVIGHLESLGVEGADARLCKKGSTWVLALKGGDFVAARYLEPPRTGR